MAISNFRLQFLLSQDTVFTGRLQVALTSAAALVLGETGIGATHQARAAYAKYVLANPAGATSVAAVYLAGSTNVAGTITDEDEGPRTSVTDAALASQIATSWNVLAGIDSGN